MSSLTYRCKPDPANTLHAITTRSNAFTRVLVSSVGIEIAARAVVQD